MGAEEVQQPRQQCCRLLEGQREGGGRIVGVLCGAREGRGCWLLAMVRSAPRPCCFVQWYFSRAGFSTLQRGGYTALVQTQLEAGGGAWGHLVWQGHYLAARQGKSVVAGTHPRIPGNPDGHSRSAQRWQVGNRRGGGAGLQEIIQPNLGPGSTGAQAVTRSPQHTSQETEILIQ